jgi:hypothetical protein
VKEARSDKRRSRRSRVDIPIVCSRVTATPDGAAYRGRIENCSRDGLCAEMARDFRAGTVLSVRPIRHSGDCADRPEVRCMAVAEVRWSRPRSLAAEACYGIGLKYLVL